MIVFGACGVTLLEKKTSGKELKKFFFNRNENEKEKDHHAFFSNTSTGGEVSGWFSACSRTSYVRQCLYVRRVARCTAVS